MATLNTQIDSVIKEAYRQYTGQEPSTEEAGKQLDLSDFTDIGNTNNLTAFKEQFTKALVIASVKTFFTDSSYEKEYNDPFFEDSQRYGTITQMVAIEVPDVQASHAWKEWESGDTVGTYEVYLPVVHTQYYGKTGSWELPITITYEQWDDAVKNREGLEELTGYVLMVCQNKILAHLEDSNALNRNNFIAEKIAYAGSDNATGIHVVNLAEVAGKAFGKSYTREQYLADPEALRNGTATIRLFTKYLRKQSTQFNTAGYIRFTPQDRLVVQVLSQFESIIDSVLMSDTFHNEMVALPMYESIPYWQDSEGLAFDTVSSINVKTSTGAEIEKDGIVCFMADKWSILHTLKKQRVATKNFDPEALDNYYYQFRDCYMNNLTMNGVVFVVDDYTHPSA